MNPIIVQQSTLDDALVAPDNHAIIGKCNMRIEPIKNLKEVTYQAILDALKHTTCYKALLVTADVPEIYMHQVEVFRDVLQICPRIHHQEFVEPPNHEEIVTFIKELSYHRELKSITEMHIDHMSQPWKTFASIINRCLSGKVT
ncbi:hypothetical protein Tco_0315254, partial [Tanacetum coccineum]